MKKSRFAEQVIELVKLVPRGRVSTYGAIAKYLGANKSSRLVGTILGKAVHDAPAHRIVNRNGLLSGKHAFETPTTMQALLEAEGLTVKEDCVQNFQQVLWDPGIEL